MSFDLAVWLARIKAERNAMPEAERVALEAREQQAQRESWIRGMAPCEHGDSDWETCEQCLTNLKDNK